MQISQISNPILNKSVNFKGIMPEKITSLAQNVKTQLVLADLSPIASYKKIQLLNEDPAAVMYGLVGHVGDILDSHGKIGTIQIPLRKSREKLNASIMKYCFNNDTQRYSIKRLGETLAYVDTILEDEGNIYIQYLCSIQGRKKFRGLEQKVIQAAVEDVINQKQIIPEITAAAANIGNTSIDRIALYKYMGAEGTADFMEVKGIKIPLPSKVFCTKKTIIEKLDKMAKRDGFIFPQTKEIFERLKESISNI